MYPIRPIEKNRAHALEPLGSKSKFWFREGDHRFLFKADSRGTGEDWAEVISFQLARLLGLPCVAYELATEFENGVAGMSGVICENMAPTPRWLVLGNQLLLALDPGYPAEQRYRMQHHTVSAVVKALEFIEMPLPVHLDELPDNVNSALDVFVGYVMLDAWVANQDRHHENWGAVSDGSRLNLAPTFDHGAALARNLLDTEREERLTTKDRNRQIEYFARRARSAFYETTGSKRPMLTHDAFRAFANQSSRASNTWLQRLRRITEKDIRGIIDQVPAERMTSICKEFTRQLLLANQELLLTEEAV